MTRNQLILVEAVAENNLSKAKQAAIACCTEDTTQKNQHKVSRLKNLLEGQGGNLIELPRDVSKFARLEDLSLTFNEARYFLTKNASEIFNQVKLMNDVSLELMERGVPYLNATLLYGKSGTGKTMLGRYIAYKLGLPFFYINFSQVISSGLGDTAKNLYHTIQYAIQNRCLLMLDEIDCISSSRADADSSAGREMARTTTCLIQMLDTIPNNVVIIGTTNLLRNVDSAVKRRFSQQYEMPAICSEDIERMVEDYVADAGFSYDEDSVRQYAQKAVAANHRKVWSDIMTDMVQAMAKALIQGQTKIFLSV